MIRKLFSIFLLIFLITGNLQSQVPGYLGKKIRVGYNFNFFPVINPLFYDFYSSPKIILSIKHEGIFGITFSKRSEISFSFISQKNMFYYTRSSFAIDNYGRRQGNEVQSSIYELNYKYFIQKFISPVGSYAEIGFAYCQSGFTDKDPVVTLNSYDTGVFDINGDGSQLRYKKLSIGAGNTKMITDFMYFNMSFKICKYYDFTYHRNLNYSSSETIPVLDFIKNETSTMNWLESKFGIGFLF
jgi:hypothetical protein